MVKVGPSTTITVTRPRFLGALQFDKDLGLELTIPEAFNQTIQLCSDSTGNQTGATISDLAKSSRVKLGGQAVQQ
ncbi:hypothetical protein RRG08_064511 [Elysia crispata]|uniref:Uncharacterized protein n=1 Tax=Elysia crispata TaxID=231223 RepID=A0AAE1AGF8_9GAST|nr:hypothetical protein RRG08_064511 [Elysia crispata]